MRMNALLPRLQNSTCDLPARRRLHPAPLSLFTQAEGAQASPLQGEG
jgi:hypothetical protein